MGGPPTDLDPERWSPNQRIGFMVEAGGILASLDYEPAVAALGRHVVPAIADWWAVDFLEPGGELRRAFVCGRHATDDLTGQLIGRYPPWLEAGRGPWLVVRTGRPELLTRVVSPLELALSADPAHLAILKRLGLGSAICVPVSFQRRVLGVMTFGRVAWPYRPSHLALARTLGNRVGQAVTHGRMYQELKESNRAKDQFLAMLGHELRNPLGALANAIAILRRPGVTADTRGIVEAIIERQVGQLTKLTSELLDIARLTSGKIVLQPVLTDLKALAERCVATLRTAGNDGGHDIRLRGESTLVLGDPGRLEQVLDNLLDNAVKFTPAGGAVEVEVTRDGASAVLRVKDDGVGVAADLLPRMFEPFTQGAQGIERREGGLGLGLAIVKRLVELHGGTIQAWSGGTNAGTEILVRLPLAADGVSAAGVGGVAASVEPRRVLVVEDNPDAREALRLVLELAGHDVELAEDGRAGLDAALRGRAQVALIDLGLPRLDGFAVAREIRARLGDGAMRLVALTGYGQPHDRRRALDAGFDAYLVKPVDRAGLLEAIAGVERDAVARQAS